MILGRNPALFIALGQSILNLAAAAIVAITGHPISAADAAVFVAANAVLIALVGVIANESDPTTVGTLAPTLHAPALAVAASDSPVQLPSDQPPTAADPAGIAAADPGAEADTSPPIFGSPGGAAP